MILVIDVGNTNITFGVYESKKLVTTFRMTSRTMRTSDEYGTEILAMLQNNQIDHRKVGGAIIASVVPKVMHALIGAVMRYLHTEPLIVGSGIKTGIKITSENPKEIGPDRIVDVLDRHSQRYAQLLVYSGINVNRHRSAENKRIYRTALNRRAQFLPQPVVFFAAHFLTGVFGQRRIQRVQRFGAKNN